MAELAQVGLQLTGQPLGVPVASLDGGDDHVPHGRDPQELGMAQFAGEVGESGGGVGGQLELPSPEPCGHLDPQSVQEQLVVAEFLAQPQDLGGVDKLLVDVAGAVQRPAAVAQHGGQGGEVPHPPGHGDRLPAEGDPFGVRALVVYPVGEPAQGPGPRRTVGGAQTLQRLLQQCPALWVGADRRGQHAAVAEGGAGEQVGGVTATGGGGRLEETGVPGRVLPGPPVGVAQGEQQFGAQPAAVAVQHVQRAAVVQHRAVEGGLRQGPVAGEPRVVDGPVGDGRVRGRPVVVGELGVGAGLAVLEGVPDPAVQPGGPGEAQVVPQEAADDRVREDVPGGLVVVLVHQTGLLRLVEEVEQAHLVDPGRGAEDVHVELVADHGGDVQRGGALPGQPAQPPAHQIPHGLGDLDLGRGRRPRQVRQVCRQRPVRLKGPRGGQRGRQRVRRCWQARRHRRVR